MVCVNLLLNIIFCEEDSYQSSVLYDRYNQCFDLEGESGIVVRGIGTAVTLTKLQEISSQPPLPLDITAVDE
jgi:hypothetical protein